MEQITLPRITKERWLIIGLAIILLVSFYKCNDAELNLAVTKAKTEQIK